MQAAPHFAPSARGLARFVEGVRIIAPAGGSALQTEWLPDGRTLLILRSFGLGRGGDVTVAGPRTKALFKSTPGVERVVVIVFKPGWSAPLLGISANVLADQVVPFEDIWGPSGGNLGAELLDAPTVPDLFDQLSQALALRGGGARESASARLARRAVPLLEQRAVRVERVAEQLGVTARHLRRAFTENVGIGPKEFARTARLQRAVRMTATSKDWAEIARAAGYYDQAHLISDFRDLVGITPEAFLKRASESARPTAGK